MKAYIRNIAASYDAAQDLRQIVPDPLMRRRMSRIVRDGVAAAARCAGNAEVDAILTATGYGCLTDSEKFLRSMLDSDCPMLPPTPFIQSTFNTVGAAVAQLQRCHGYNTTYAHGSGSFAAALLDAMMLLGEGSAALALVGAVEESTPTLRTLLGRMRAAEVPEQGGAVFFLLSADAAGARARIDAEVCPAAAPKGYTDPLASARRLYEAVRDAEDRTLAAGNLKLTLRCF